MVLTGFIFLQLDRTRSLHMVDCGKLAVLGADKGISGIIWSVLIIAFLRLAQFESLSEFNKYF